MSAIPHKDFRLLPMQPSDIEYYMINFSYGENANGENGQFNCWGLLRDVQARFFGISLPKSNLGDEIAELYNHKMKSGSWEIVDKPFHGCGVLMREGIEPHCGVWLDFDGGGVLHCERGNGIRFQNMASLRMSGYSHLKYYRFNNG